MRSIDHCLLLLALWAFLLIGCAPSDVPQDSEASYLAQGTIRLDGELKLPPCELPEPQGVDRDRPNVVLIAVDTLRADRLGFLGGSLSPNLDALAEDSLVFEHAIAPAPWTTPSMAGVMTGIAPVSMGITWDPLALPAEADTLAEVLKRRGFLTAGVVSHLYLGETYGFHRGFDAWDETAAGSHEDISSPWVTAMAGRCLRAMADRGPFFLFAHYFDPHFEYLPHGTHPVSDGYTGPLSDDTLSFETLREQAQDDRLTTGDLAHLRALYDSEVAFTDEHVGRLLEQLKSLDLYDDSLIVFVADHGEMLAERQERWIGHTQYLYEELVHVPLLIKLPAGRKRGRVRTTVSTQSIFGTVLREVGVTGPFPSLSYDTTEPSWVFTQTRRWRGVDAAYHGPWKLIHDHDSGYRLFDLHRDPGERDDLAADYPEVLERMKHQLAEWNTDVQSARSRFTPSQAPVLSEEEQDRLRALGYVN